ncbi:MAG: rod shape-determining protein MreC [Okeania sp. SIO2H7]|nr:rod shape-determining protein MreC [Okeania sp. SIO2H7]
MQIVRARRRNKFFQKIVAIALAVGLGLWVRQTKGALLVEIYHQLAIPFTANEERSQTQLINARIQELEIRIKELEKQNQNLKSLLDYSSKQKLEGSGIVAPVVGRSADNWWNQITLGKGANDGIEENFIVMGPGGIVGRITSVTARTSRVLLISDPTSQIGVGIIRSRQMGSMRGTDENRGVLEFFDDVPDVNEGDLVSTSAYSQLFPAGLPVGTVKSVELSKTPAPEALIEFSVPINSLEWVIVYPHNN